MLIPMAVTDAMFLLAENRNAPMHVGALQLFSPPPGQAGPGAVGELYRRLLSHTEVAAPYNRRPRRNVLTAGQWAWETEEDVELEHHVRRSALPAPGRPRELMELVGRLHSTLLDRSRPLWETHVIEGLNDGRFAIYTKMHHSLVDGVAGIRLVQGALNADPEARDLPAPWTPRPSSGRKERGLRARTQALVGTARDLVTATPALAKTVYRGLSAQEEALPFQAPRTLLNSDISGSRRFAAQSWPTERLKNVARSIDGTVNDAVVAMCSGALRRYLLELDALPDAPLVAMVPVSLRTGPEDTRSNAVGTLLCSLATDLPDPGARLLAVQQSLKAGKAGLQGMSPAAVTLLSAGIMGSNLAGGLLKSHRVGRPAYNVVISNVPGSRQPLFHEGAHLEAVYPLSIPQDGQALNITVVGNEGSVGFGLVGCRRTLPHLQTLLGHLEDELAALELSQGL